ncbi:MAG: alkaline phosphatase family protein [Nocardioidaceae bacterium]
MTLRRWVTAVAVVLLVADCSRDPNGSRQPIDPVTSAVHGAAKAATPLTGGSVAGRVPRFDHVVVVALENHGYSQIIGAPDAPFVNSLADSGAVLTNAHAVAHPSEPNYLALFSGSTHGLSDDSCPHDYTGPNLGSALIGAGHTFVGYSEDLPAPGFTGCGSGGYARKHNPWVDFPALPSAVNQPMSAFPTDYAALPTVSFVVPNLDHDMHDGTVAQGDQWLKAHLGAYATWATTHNSLLIVTTDEAQSTDSNQIATIIDGAHVRPGHYGAYVDHYGLLKTLLVCYRLTPFARTVAAVPITTIWNP